MELHLAVALLKCTPTPPRLCRQQPHLGWSADLAAAAQVLAALLRAHDLRRTTIAALAAFTPPLAGLVGWRKLALCALHRRRHGQPEKLLVHGAAGHLGAALHRRPRLRQVR